MGYCFDSSLLRYTTYYLLIVPIVVLSEKRECIDGSGSLGYTVPTGDIHVKYGDPLDIYCVIHDEIASARGPNASQHLTFQINDSRELGRDMVQVINSTTIKLHIDKPEKQISENYYCVLMGQNGEKKKSICMNLVDVGVPPQPVKDFKCISYNLDNLTCTWTAPENFVNTEYHLYYSQKPSSELFNCPMIKEANNTKLICMWSLSTSPIYRTPLIDYYFHLSMSNVFGNYTMPIINFKHLENVKPNAPENLRVLSKTWNSVNLSWTVPSTLTAFNTGLIHRVLFTSSYDKGVWKCSGKCSFFKRNARDVVFNLENLEYAHAYYDIRVSMISAGADQTDEILWSDNATLTVLTASKRPDEPPKTTVGSFEIISFSAEKDRNVQLYWSHIPEERRNGENFTYVVSVDDQVNMTEKSYMSWNGLSPHRNYTFKIRAKNEMGISHEESIIFVPADHDYPGLPTKLISEELGNGYYHFSWKPPPLRSDQIISNYTIFWCNDERDGPPCSKKMDWVVVPASPTSHVQSIPSDKTYQFAISANSLRGSSGMIWTLCTDSYYKYGVGRITDFELSKNGSDFIQAKWSFRCNGKSVTGYIIYYCPIKSPLPDAVCIEPEKNITVPRNENSAIIENLKPNTLYSLKVAAIINHTTYGQPSANKTTSTLEAAPSTPPTNLKETNITNTTITITWVPPAVTNGRLRNYNIFYKNKTVKIDPNVSTYTLTGLISFENYGISMEACTKDCSSLSEILNVQTLIGYPGVIRRPFMTQNETCTLISWDKPEFPNGRNERFELRITEKHDYENVTSIINTTDREWGIYNCGKEKKFYSFFVSVRAVNIDGDKVYYGSWSEEVESYCRPPSSFIIYILVTTIVLFLLAMSYFSKKIYSHFQEMRDVGVKLPQGLQGEVTDADMNLSSWVEKPPNDDSDSHTAEDEKRLMLKGDSSGCSSAQGSVTCSVNSNCNVSSNTSDSGTEHPITSSAEDLSELGMTTSLRQRNIRPSSISKPYVTLPLDSSNLGSTKNYCIIGVDQNIDNEVSNNSCSNYIPLPSMIGNKEFSQESSQHSPQYVLTGELVKTPNPNYIPFKTTISPDLATKNPSYVVAGSKDLISSETISNIEQPQQQQQDSAYVKIADNMIALKNPEWQPPSLSTNTKTGYVSIGEIPAKKETKGYVPHRQFESKALKED